MTLSHVFHDWFSRLLENKSARQLVVLPLNLTLMSDPARWSVCEMKMSLLFFVNQSWQVSFSFFPFCTIWWFTARDRDVVCSIRTWQGQQEKIRLSATRSFLAATPTRNFGSFHAKVKFLPEPSAGDESDTRTEPAGFAPETPEEPEVVASQPWSPSIMIPLESQNKLTLLLRIKYQYFSVSVSSQYFYENKNIIWKKS